MWCCVRKFLGFVFLSPPMSSVICYLSKMLGLVFVFIQFRDLIFMDLILFFEYMIH